MVEKKDGNGGDVLVFPPRPRKEGKAVLPFSPREVKPDSVFITADTTKTGGIMTSEVMFEAIGRHVAGVKAEIAANRKGDKKDGDDDEKSVVVDVYFGNDETQ